MIARYIFCKKSLSTTRLLFVQILYFSNVWYLWSSTVETDHAESTDSDLFSEDTWSFLYESDTLLYMNDQMLPHYCSDIECTIAGTAYKWSSVFSKHFCLISFRENVNNFLLPFLDFISTYLSYITFINFFAACEKECAITNFAFSVILSFSITFCFNIWPFPKCFMYRWQILKLV